MALIKKIREKSGIAVGLVALGLGLFIVGGDIIGPNSTLLGQNNQDVGVIAGEKVSYNQYQQQIEKLRYNFTLQAQRNPTEAEMYSIRQQAWDFLIVKIAFQEQFEELGLEVTDEEVVDMVQGNNIRPEIAESFRNPETGEVDRSQIVQYLQNLNQLPQQQQAGWYLFEENLRPSRLRIKYDNLLLKADYVTSAEARRVYELENTVAETRYVYVPYYSISDTAVQVSDDELRTYLNNHKEEYQVDESRTARYVRFPIQPSAEDTAYIRQELLDLAETFRSSEDDSVFAAINTDGQNPYDLYNLAELPEQLRANLGNLSEGDVRGPYQNGQTFTLYKISEAASDTISAARASHILLSDRTFGSDDEARAEAERLLRELRGGADFAELAQQYSEDPSKSRGGDLGWFTEGRMVEPFENAVFNANRPGLINRVIETDYGFHIINVTETATDRAFRIASIEREIVPSEQTRNEIFRRADRFASTVSNLKEFNEAASRDSLQAFTAENIGPNDRRINTLANAREIVRWLYADASVGDVSDVYELENEYVVVALAEKVEKGVAKLDDVRNEILIKVRNQKKGEMIADKLSQMEGSLEEIAEAYGPDANVYSSSDITLSDNVLPTAGAAPEAIGRLFSLEEGQRTEPVATDNGVVIAELVALTEAPEINDYEAFKERVDQSRNRNVSFNLSELIKDFSNIEDKRYRFY